jgi:hypothetical protein
VPRRRRRGPRAGPICCWMAWPAHLRGLPGGAPVLRQAVSAFRGPDLSREEELRWLWLASHAARIVWDHAGCDVLSDRQVTLARDAGALITLPIAFNTRARVHLFAGEFTEAASLAAQAESVAEETGSSIAPYGALALARLPRPGSASRSADPDRHRRRGGAGVRVKS